MAAPLNVALVGYGYAGKVHHAPVIVTTPGLTLHTVVSSDAAKVHADLPQARVTPTLEEALADPAVELVVIATPNETHAPLARRALELGRHVVIDKPFAITVAQARGLIEQAERAGRLLSVYHNRRWDSGFLTVRRLIEGGELGEVVHCELHFDRWRPQVLDRWRERDTPGSGVWYDLGSHLADNALVLFGRPLGVTADLGVQKEGGRAVDWFHVLLRYERLRVVLHSGSITARAGATFTVHGTKASYVKPGLDTQEGALLRRARPGEPDFGVDPVEGELTIPQPDGAFTTRKVPTERGNYPAFYAGVRDAIRLGAPNPVPPSEALAVMELLEAGLRSCAERREIPL
jgi:predicted dehydrogenase